jgi:FHA domain/GAF domain
MMTKFHYARLVVEGRGNWVFTHRIGDADRVTIGRTSKSDVSLGDMLASSCHAEIVRRGDVFYLCDLGSRNGTVVNGEKITEHLLRNGDSIRIGESLMSYLADEDESDAATAFPSSSPSPSPDETTIKFKDLEANAFQPITERLESLKSALNAPGQSGVNAEELLATGMEDLQVSLREAEGTIRRLTFVNEFSGILAAHPAQFQMLPVALDYLAAKVEAENGFIMQIDKATQKWVVRSRYGSIQDWVSTEKGATVPMSLTLVEQAIKTAEMVVYRASDDDERFSSSVSLMTLGIQACLCFPLIENGQAQGVVYVDRRSFGNFFNQDDEALLAMLSQQLNEVLYPKAI